MDAAAELGRNPVFSLSMEMSRLTRGGTAKPVSRDQILRHARGQGNINFPCSADHEQDWQPYRLIYTLLYVLTIHTYIQKYISVHQQKVYRVTKVYVCSDFSLNSIKCTTYVHVLFAQTLQYSTAVYNSKKCTTYVRVLVLARTVKNYVRTYVRTYNVVKLFYSFPH